MGRAYKAEFRDGGMRLALGSDLSRDRIAQDLGIGGSTLKEWIHPQQDIMTKSIIDVSFPISI